MSRVQKSLEAAFDLARTQTNYLAQLIDAFPDVTVQSLAETADAPLSEISAQVEALADAQDVQQIMRDMRRLKRRAHLITALFDLSRLWDWDEATRALTEFADICLKAALTFAGRDSGFAPGNAGPVPGLFALAVGKYGAHELNYSSDIDFMVFYDPAIIVLPDVRKPELALIRLVQKIIKIVDTVNADGYVFRCDLRLRPDPRSNAVAVSTTSAERYYESLGQNWERAAMIKARVCAGDIGAGDAFMTGVLRHFIWRRSLDFAAIADIQAMKRQINSGGGHNEIHPAGHHLKLGRGGIREVEFFAQTQQLILGGRHERLRCIRTDEALNALGVMGFQEENAQGQMIVDYGFLRDLEHRVQMIDDAQTHICPQDDAARLRVARLAGFDDLKAFDAAVVAVLTRVNAAYTALYPDAGSLASEAGTLSFTGVEAGPNTLETLEKLGFTRGADVWSVMSGWLGGRTAATRTVRARESLTRLAPAIIEGCSRTGLPDESFFRFAQFFENLKAGISILAMFERQPDLLSEAIDLMAQAPRLAEILSAKPEILDVLIEPDFADAESSVPSFLSNPENDLESEMNAVRRVVREQHFKIGAAVLAGRIEPHIASEKLAILADKAVARLAHAAQRDVERRLDCPGGDMAVLAMGKMGGREMTVTSDLDIMVLYDPGEADPGKAHIYYTKVTQRLIAALSAPTQEGGLYEVDMALRPSGSAGPITVSMKAFSGYYADQAWTWEFMALTRARVSWASSEKMNGRVVKTVKGILAQGRDTVRVQSDVLDMRQRLERDKPAKSDWDIKMTGGGIVDIEFIAQYLQLIGAGSHPGVLNVSTRDALIAAQYAGFMGETELATLINASQLYDRVRAYLSVAVTGLFDPQSAPRLVSERLSALCGFDDFADFNAHYDDVRKKVRDIFTTIVGAV